MEVPWKTLRKIRSKCNVSREQTKSSGTPSFVLPDRNGNEQCDTGSHFVRHVLQEVHESIVLGTGGVVPVSKLEIRR